MSEEFPERLTKFMEAGFRFNFSKHSTVPEIPKIQDVLYALRVENMDEAFDFAWANSPIYISNVYLAAAAVSFPVAYSEEHDREVARRIVAMAIVALCPDEAKCLFNGAYVAAKLLTSEGIPGLKQRMTVKETWSLCGCTRCKDMLTVDTAALLRHRTMDEIEEMEDREVMHY